MRVIFRADAGLHIGTGHVMRCLTLAEALRACGAECGFVTRDHTGHLAGRISARGFAVSLLPAGTGDFVAPPPAHAGWAGVHWTQDAAETLAATDGADWMVVDHYALDARWERAVAGGRMRLMVIDDLADRPHAANLVLDQKFGHSPADHAGLLPAGCRCLAGPRHALLRPEFAQTRAQSLSDRDGRGLRHLIVTLGGVDRGDATSAVLEALRTACLPPDLRITVIMGSDAPALERVRALARDMPRPTRIAVNLEDMAALMAGADLAIGAGGGTTWERCCLGLPCVTLETAPNQKGVAPALADAGAGFDPGPPEGRDFVHNLQAAIAEASDPARLDAMSQKAASLCDGDGTPRVLAALVPSEVGFRCATRADSQRVWEWRDALDDSFRVSDEKPPYAEHDRWFRKAVSEADPIIRILTQGALARGYLRLDRTGATSARVSICLAPDARGQGLGRRLLVEADRLGARLGLERLVAEIHEGNGASRKVFEAAGYVERGSKDGFRNCSRTLENTT